MNNDLWSIVINAKFDNDVVIRLTRCTQDDIFHNVYGFEYDDMTVWHLIVPRNRVAACVCGFARIGFRCAYELCGSYYHTCDVLLDDITTKLDVSGVSEGILHLEKLDNGFEFVIRPFDSKSSSNGVKIYVTDLMYIFSNIFAVGLNCFYQLYMNSSDKPTLVCSENLNSFIYENLKKPVKNRDS
jgi:hypothetical protein